MATALWHYRNMYFCSHT